MSNVYGFNFLNAEHLPASVKSEQRNINISEIQSSPALEQELSPIELAEDKNDLEKQFDIIKFLQTHRSSGCLPPGIIYKSCGVDLSEGGRDETVAKLLLKNARIKVEEIPDPENPSLTIYTWGYQAKFNNVRNRTGLIAQINRSKNGVRQRDLLDSYEGIKGHIDELITSGDIIAVTNTDDKDKILYPRGEPFLVELDGHVSIDDVPLEELVRRFTPPHAPVIAPLPGTGSADTSMNTSAKEAVAHVSDEIMQEATHKAQLEASKNLYVTKTDINPKKQLRRGEAVWVGGQWFRVSSAVREGVPLSEQPAKAQAPLSVSSRKELSRKNEVDGYIRHFDEHVIPLDHELKRETKDSIKLAKEAQAKLHKVAAAHGRAVMTGGAGAQLLSSNATDKGPEQLAAAFASTASSASLKRRSRINNSSQLNTKKSAEQIEAAKKAASDPSLLLLHARRHGCTIDVRELYLATSAEIPTPDKEVEIFNMMVEHKLLEPSELMKRPRMSKKNMTLDENGRPRKRRYYERKGQRMTNTHLIGTEIGQALAAAAEKQHSGKSVGDGGM